MSAERPSLALVWAWLGQVADPEIPVLSVVDLGIVREVAWVDGGGYGYGGHGDGGGGGDGRGNGDGGGDGGSGGGDVRGEDVLRVTVTPTYSGCPATRVIERDITSALRGRGVERVVLEVRLAPPWTTEWLSVAGRDKLRAYGISPPATGATGALAHGGTGAPARGRTAVLDLTPVVEPGVACPRCGAGDVELTSRFGSTPCKALYRCNACREPFDHFKCH